VNDHDIIRDLDPDVECRCGWTGPRHAHPTHFAAATAADGIAAARAALEGETS
jgi:hypothetical protein